MGWPSGLDRLQRLRGRSWRAGVLSPWWMMRRHSRLLSQRGYIIVVRPEKYHTISLFWPPLNTTCQPDPSRVLSIFGGLRGIRARMCSLLNPWQEMSLLSHYTLIPRQHLLFSITPAVVMERGAMREAQACGATTNSREDLLEFTQFWRAWRGHSMRIHDPRSLARHDAVAADAVEEGGLRLSRVRLDVGGGRGGSG